jgi:hypothetical protein
MEAEIVGEAVAVARAKKWIARAPLAWRKAKRNSYEIWLETAASTIG